MPLTRSRFHFGSLALIALVALRLGIGWQFFKEGTDKIQSGKPFSAGFLGSAKGPLAPTFQSMVWDADGEARLNLDATIQAWERFRDQAARHYGFDQEQQAEAQAVFQRYAASVKDFFATNSEDIAEYWLQRERLQKDRNPADPRSASMREVASLSGQVDKREAEWKGKRGPWLAAIDKMWSHYERDIHALGAGKGRALALAAPGRRFLDSRLVDQVIPWFDLGVGALLILGLFTRTTAIVAAAFLGSIVLTQWPGTRGAAPTYYQFNLMLALLVLAATGTGRFAGLDFFIARIRSWCCRPKQES